MTQMSRLPREGMKNSLSRSKWCFAKKKFRFQWDYYSLSVLKLALEIRAVSRDFPSEFAEVIFLFFPVERAVVFAISLPFFLRPAFAVYSGTLSDLIKYFRNPQ